MLEIPHHNTRVRHDEPVGRNITFQNFFSNIDILCLNTTDVAAKVLLHKSIEFLKHTYYFHHSSSASLCIRSLTDGVFTANSKPRLQSD